MLLIRSPACFRNNKKKEFFSFEPTYTELDQKQYWRFGGMMVSIKMQNYRNV